MFNPREMSQTQIQEYIDEEYQLAFAIHKLGIALTTKKPDDVITDLTQLQQQTLLALISLPKWQLLRECFSLTRAETSLLAVVYMFQLMPDLLSAYADLNWYERGPGISAERALLLMTDRSAFSKNELLQHGRLVASHLLVTRDPANPFMQTLSVSEPLMSFLTHNDDQNRLDLQATLGVLTAINDRVNPATHAAYASKMVEPSSGINIVSPHDDQESLSFITALLHQRKTSRLPLADLWVIDSSNAESPDALVIEKALLAAKLLYMPNHQAIYWPTFWQDSLTSPEMRVLAEQLAASSTTLLFCCPLKVEEQDKQPQWVINLLNNSTQYYELDASVEHKTHGWLALFEQHGCRTLMDVRHARTLAERYRLSTSQMFQALNTFLSEEDQSFSGLQKVCLSGMRASTDGLATFTLPRITLRDMVLATPIKNQLEEVLARVRFKPQLATQTTSFLEGTQALFWGPPGTGKSMAAEAIAGELQLPLYKVNLANVASKWIGETEKHLANLFDQAEEQNAVLLFDEADAIFAKRSEVESSHDKNANMGVSFLLQRMETYKGMLLLSTNFKANIDDAFLRRFAAVTEFALPDHEQRKQLWQRVWKGSLSPHPHVNMAYLAKEFKLSPSQIRNVAERACLYALMEGEKTISQQILSKALRRELDKQSAGFMAAQIIDSWPTAQVEETTWTY